MEELKQYVGYDFGTSTRKTEEYSVFQNRYVYFIKKLCKKNEWKLTTLNKRYFSFSVFIKNKEEKFVYISIPDVRGSNDRWLNTILIREAKDEKDYTGGINRFTTLSCLEESIKTLFEKRRKDYD
jgi:hypothetical protein